MKPYTQKQVDDYIKGYRTTRQPHQKDSVMFIKGYMEAKLINNLRSRTDIDWNKLPHLAEAVGINEEHL